MPAASRMAAAASCPEYWLSTIVGMSWDGVCRQAVKSRYDALCGRTQAGVQIAYRKLERQHDGWLVVDQREEFLVLL